MNRSTRLRPSRRVRGKVSELSKASEDVLNLLKNSSSSSCLDKDWDKTSRPAREESSVQPAVSVVVTTGAEIHHPSRAGDAAEVCGRSSEGDEIAAKEGGAFTCRIRPTAPPEPDRGCDHVQSTSPAEGDGGLRAARSREAIVEMVRGPCSRSTAS